MIDAVLETLLHPALWIGAIAVGMLGEVAKKLVLGPRAKWPKDGFRGWRGVYYVTLPLHAMAAGVALWWGPALLGYPLPVSAAFDGDGGYALFGLGVGALSVVGYATFVEGVQRALKSWSKKLGEGGAE